MRNEYADTYVTKFPDPFTAYLYEVSLNGPDQETGDLGAPTGWVGLLGRNLLREDSQGFVYRERYASVAAAVDAFEVVDAEYGDWADDDS